MAEEYQMVLRHTLFPLHPDTPEEGQTLEELFGGRMDVDAARQRMQSLMDAEGLAFGRRTHTYNSRRAQELAKWAEQQEGGDRIHDALYRAYFVDGRNLWELETLRSVAEALGLDADAAEDAVVSGRFAPAVDQDWARSRALGVTGVPTFVVGRQGVVGAQPYAVLERLATAGGARRRGGDASDDADHPT